MTQPLALDNVAHGEATGWRRGEELIDALPYIDTLTVEERHAADQLISEEMTRGTKRPSDYLKELPPVPKSRFEDHPVLQAEYERVKRGEPMQMLDKVRYELQPPPLNKRNDYAAWKAALDNAHTQLEHQNNRLLNLELLIKYGPNAYRVHNDQLELYNNRLEAELAAVKDATETVNAERKLAQVAVGQQLVDLEGQWMDTITKTKDIFAACTQLETDIRELRASLGIIDTAATEPSLAGNSTGSMDADADDADDMEA